MIRVRVPLEELRTLLFHDSGAVLTVTRASRDARDGSMGSAKTAQQGAEANHAN